MQLFHTLLAVLLALPAAAQTGGYAGQQARDIKALSAQETADLLAGRGMGLARAGELNRHPGPAHVLELRGPLALSPDQVQAVQASFGRMESAAKPLGAELIGLERALDAGFRAGTITAAAMASQTELIGALMGRIRAVHLAAHIEMRSVLTPQQIEAYDRLRGYADGGPQHQPGGHGHRPNPG